MKRTRRVRRAPERDKKQGVCYAFAPDGVELPVIDITHPAFQPLREKPPQANPWLAAFKRLPVLRTVWERWRRRSPLVRGFRRAEGSFLGGLDAYRLKLGPENLGRAYAGAMDRRIAAGALARSLAWRLAAMAHLLAEAVEPRLDRPGTPIEMINIGGGAAMDSLNALILLAKRRPGALKGRRIIIQVLDLEKEGPVFGSRALRALQKPGAPLAGLKIRFRHIPYDWSDPAPLRALLKRRGIRKRMAAGSAEGSLFSYASDGEIAEHLEMLRGAVSGTFRLVGSLAARSASGIRPEDPALRDRSPTALAALARRAGWRIRFTGGTDFSRYFYLAKAGKGRPVSGKP